jgi:hypothetical protein
MKEIKPKLAHNFWVESSWKKETEQKWMIMKSSFFFFEEGQQLDRKVVKTRFFFFFFNVFLYFCGNTEYRGQENGAKLIFSLSLYYSDFVLIRDFRSRLSNEFLDELERTTNVSKRCGFALLLFMLGQVLILGILIRSLLHMQLFFFTNYIFFSLIVGFISVSS